LGLLKNRYISGNYALQRGDYGENQTKSVTELSRISLYNVSEGAKTLLQ
jgi:hypothetical protein